MEIVIIGTGNAATILGRKLKAAGHTIVQVFGRNASAASELAYILEAESASYWSVVHRNADLYLIAVADSAIEEVTRELRLPGKLVVHTAASVSKDVLQPISDRYGILYPLQSLQKDTDHLPETPLLIDAGDAETLRWLELLAGSLSAQVMPADDALRGKLHLAAVFCNNFTNHLYVLAEAYCRQEGIDFNLLKPLIRETAERLESLPPQKAQTGPALRRDGPTLERHRQLLRDYPRLRAFYDLFTESIGYNS